MTFGPRFILAALVLLGASPAAAQRPDSGTAMAMPGMGSAMPIPMPPGMVMIPGLVGLAPAVTPFLPGVGVDPASLAVAGPMRTVTLASGDTFDLTASLVRRVIRGHWYVTYAFNGEVPGPLITMPAGATVTVRFHNRIDLPSSIHWHGIRLDNRFDGVPGVTQAAVAPGDSFVYRVHAPDGGMFWYHPHVREDIEQALGLFGGIDVVTAAIDSAPVNARAVLFLDDLLVNADTLIPFGREVPDFTLMGRVGNVLMVNGGTDYRLAVRAGDVVRFYLVNTASSRTFNLSFGGAPIKVIGSDVGRFEREARVPSVVIAPAERYIVDVRFDSAGSYPVLNEVQAINHFIGEFRSEVDTLGVVTAAGATLADHHADFDSLHTNTDVVRDMARYRSAFDRPPDKRFTLTVSTHGLALPTAQFMTIDTAYYAPVEWIDGMPDMNWLSTADQVRWEIRDDATGKTDRDIDWHVPAGSLVKVRFFNDNKSFHPMQHPIHLHGQRMLVLARDGVRNTNLVWKDTILIPVGSTVDVLIDAANPGDWMMHCHIAEHLGAGMMAVMHVDPR
ncbi:MAG TPA: multicopper oxidase family protein [Gemmatimonadales bacterium]|nr:multicopper oxidase family protein [Gemmatimonadales bacterium]